METPQITIHDAITGKTIVRDMTADEIVSYTVNVVLPTPAE